MSGQGAVTERVAAIQRRLASATPGPWKVCGASEGKCSCRMVWSEPADVVVAVAKIADEDDGPSDAMAVENAALIANAPSDIAWLLSLVPNG